MSSRSSHRCVAADDRLIFVGGTLADSQEENNTLWTLRITGSAGVLSAQWSCEDEPQSSVRPPGMLQAILRQLLGRIP